MAASNPAETTKRQNSRLNGLARTDDKVRVELVSNRHDDLLESIDVVGITEACRRPRNVDAPRVCVSTDLTSSRQHSRPGAFADSNHVESAKVTGRIEATTVVTVNGDVQHIRVIPESALSAIAMVNVPGGCQLEAIRQVSRRTSQESGPCSQASRRSRPWRQQRRCCRSRSPCARLVRRGALGDGQWQRHYGPLDGRRRDTIESHHRMTAWRRRPSGD